MERIICEGLEFYRDMREHSPTFRISLRMRDTVDGSILQRAADAALRRYPCYAVRCIAQDGAYFLAPCDAPFAVRRTQEPVPLCGEESGGYLLAVSYWGHSMALDVFHGLTDGQGAMSFLRTLLYYYCREHYDSALPSDGVRTNENATEELLAVEWDNPYERLMSGELVMPSAEEVRIKAKWAPEKPALYLLEDSRVTRSAPVCYTLRIPEQTLMRYCRAQDGTPGVILSLLMSRAIDSLHPGNDRPIVAGMAMSLRRALGAPLYKGSALGLAMLPYTEWMRDKPFDQQAALYRSRLNLAADRQRLQAGIGASLPLYHMLEQTPTLEGKRRLVAQVLGRYADVTTFQFSYLGPSRLGAAESYVRGASLVNDTVGNTLMLELMATAGYFCLTLSQEWQESLYFDALCRELSAQCIPYEVIGHGPVRLSPARLP